MLFTSYDDIKTFFERANAYDADKIETIFYSKSTEDPKMMMYFHNIVTMNTSINIRDTIFFNKKRLMQEDLSLYKIKILFGVRGSYSVDEILEFVKTHYSDDDVKLLAKHKSCPTSIKNFMFEAYKDPDYLGEDVKECFIF